MIEPIFWKWVDGTHTVCGKCDYPIIQGSCYGLDEEILEKFGEWNYCPNCGTIILCGCGACKGRNTKLFFEDLEKRYKGE